MRLLTFSILELFGHHRPGEEVIEQFASFPSGSNDDLVDSSTQALLRFRQGGFVRAAGDEVEQEHWRDTVEYY